MPRKKSSGFQAVLATKARNAYKGVWLSPLLLLLALCTLTAFKISGTSTGIYYPVLYGQSQKNPDIVAGQPQSIRSDEWLYLTQMVIAQKAADFPRVNPNITYGKDLSVSSDVPYKEWSIVFKPQNIVFFVLPLAYAFAFKWWLLLFLVIVSCYFFVLRFFPGRRLLASLIAAGVGCSPFLFWWYQTATLAPIFYGFFILLVGIRIVNGEKIGLLKRYREAYSQVVYALVLAYLLTAFGLILYPPFQIPVVLGVAAFMAGYVLEVYGPGRQLISKKALQRLAVFVGSLVAAGGTILVFLQTRSQAVDAIQHTVYPGSRQISGGGTPVFEIFSTYLQPQLERTFRGLHFYNNQSEASSFILLLPFLLMPGFYILYLKYRQKHVVDWPLVFVQLLGLLFVADLFISTLQPLYKIFFLNIVPHARLFIGLGFVGILQLVLLMRALAAIRLPAKTWGRMAAVYSLVCLAVMAWAGHYVRANWPLFISSPVLIGLLGIIFTAIIFCVLTRKFIWAVAILFVFSAGSVYKIHPLQTGLEPLYPSKLSQAIDTVSRPGDTWVTVDELYFENAPIMANRNSLSGVQPYPNLALWRQVQGPQADNIYNRYAHVTFSTAPMPDGPFQLTHLDSFLVHFDCSAFVKGHVQYVLSGHPLTNTCTRQVDQVHYPARTFYLYKVR